MQNFRIKLNLLFEAEVEVEAENFLQAKERATECMGAVCSASMGNYDYLKDWELKTHPSKILFQGLKSDVYYKGLKFTGINLRKEKSDVDGDSFFLEIFIQDGESYETIKTEVSSSEYDYFFNEGLDTEQSPQRIYIYTRDIIEPELEKYINDKVQS